MQDLKWKINEMPKTEDKNLPLMSMEEVKKARTFHESFPQYSETPLCKLPNMAKYLGLGNIYVKDESYRFGLNAFKVSLVTLPRKPERIFPNFPTMF